MSADITLAEAITALVAEKRAVGYKYYAEAQVLARFEAFNRREFPGLDTPTEARTIYACGLRCSEARLLRVADVDIDTGVLQIRDAKGGKDRQVPVSETLHARLADYHSQTVGQPGRREWFFPSARPNQPLTLGNVYHNFRRFLWQAGISHGGPGHGPRVHDLRHTMAVNNLRSWFAHGRDVGALLPVLQTYLGHSSIADTAYYLHLTAESYPDITTRVQQVVGDVVPPTW